MLLNIPIEDLLVSQMNIYLNQADEYFSCKSRPQPRQNGVDWPTIGGITLTLESVRRDSGYSLRLYASNTGTTNAGNSIPNIHQDSCQWDPDYMPLDSSHADLSQLFSATSAFLPPLDDLSNLEVAGRSTNENTSSPASSLQLHTFSQYGECSEPSLGYDFPLSIPTGMDYITGDVEDSLCEARNTPEAEGVSTFEFEDVLDRNFEPSLPGLSLLSSRRSEDLSSETSTSDIGASPPCTLDLWSPISPPSSNVGTTTHNREKCASAEKFGQYPSFSPTCNHVLKSPCTRRMHKPPKTFPCTMGCGMAFTRRHDRERHEVARHGKKCKYVCGVCQRFFSSAKTLARHECSVRSPLFGDEAVECHEQGHDPSL